MKPEPQLIKKEYDRQRYLQKQDEILKQCAEYRKNNRKLLRQKSKEYYQKHKSKCIARSKKSKKSRTWHYKTKRGKIYSNKYQKQYAKRPEVRKLNRVREKTRYNAKKGGICSKCGKLGKTGFHHISYEPNIYEEDCLECHHKIHHH